MKSKNILKLLMIIIVFFFLLCIGNLLYSNIAYATNNGASLGDLNAFNGRK